MTQPTLPQALAEPLERAHLRPIVVDDLGHDALVLHRYGLAMIDAAALAERADKLVSWLESVLPVPAVAVAS
ncbi:hypothetical protein PROP_03148 [Propionicimonas sp. T2.31MG-18]|uniref:hypothetical protein n=1 Tax=Propionicimonas sp. T2.31MG-18 TaxID=3157620 RepID=UPI0035E65CF8